MGINLFCCTYKCQSSPIYSATCFDSQVLVMMSNEKLGWSFTTVLSVKHVIVY